MKKIGYNDKLDQTMQANVEEIIASILLDHPGVDLTEEEAEFLGQVILYTILRTFRRDFFDDCDKPKQTKENTHD